MELCQTWTSDGVQLSGMVHPPEGESRLPLGVVIIHGFSSRFYSQVVLGLAHGLARRGALVVAGNNRGHDIGALLRRREGGPLLAGAAWERLEESPHDVAAWIDVAAGRGAKRVALLGHSLGAAKAALYCAERSDPRVAALAMCSPPWQASPPRSVDDAIESQAIARLTPYPVSAQTLRSRHAMGDRLQPLELLARIHVPTMVLYGEQELGQQADAVLDRFSGYGADTAYIGGADHNYTDQEDEVAGALAGWLYGLSLA